MIAECRDILAHDIDYVLRLDRRSRDVPL
jgi:hypothetical protein